MNNEKKFIKLTPFKMQVLQSFPFIDEDFDAITNYELLCKVVEYLNKTVDNVDLLNEKVEEFENYFDNLDVQEEINNKLDKMAESGELTDIIAQYLGLAGVLAFNTVNDMKNATNLVNGSIVKTLGFYNYNDGGGSYYKIRNVSNSDIINEMNIIALNDPSLIAELVYSDTLNTRQLGFIADGITNETNKMNYLISLLKDNLTIEVNGIILTNNIVINPETTLKNVTITGKNGAIGYGTSNTLLNGIRIVKEEDYTFKDGLQFNNFNGLSLKHLLIDSTENVVNGGLPLNGIFGINLVNSPYTVIDSCSIKGFYIGIYANYTSGLLKIKNNNFSLCNVGIWFSNVGDSIVENNYFNTLGWNIYKNDNINVLDIYSGLSSRGMIHGNAMYITQGGAISIKGGKIEYCNAGLYIDVTKNLDISDIVFDRCNLYGIGFDSQTYKWTKSNSNVNNCNFIGCGNNTSVDAGLTGSCIGIKRLNNINIGNCSFKASNENYQDCFPDTSKKFYGPKNCYIKVNFSRNINVSNCVFYDNLYTIIPTNSIVNVSNLGSLQINTYSNTTGLINSTIGYKKNILLSGNSNNLTYGSFELGDMLSKAYTSASKINCTGEGSLGTISGQKCDVLNGLITDGDLSFNSSNNYILLSNYNGDNYGESDYINIDGVSGYKKIIQIVYVPSSNKYYARLNSACDVQVSNADISLHTPSFS